MAGIKQNTQKRSGKIIDPKELSIERSTESAHPVFCLRHITKSHCLSNCTKDEKSALSDTLHKLSKLSWKEIRASGRHASGCEKISKASIKSGIPANIPEGIDFFLAFRFCGKAAMVGFKDKGIFHILWLDRTFKLYSHG